MATSMYQCLIPALIRNLNNLSAFLKKGADHCAAKEIDSAVMANARLFPDMFPLYRQVQITTDVSKGAAARLSGVEAPSFEDEEAGFEELQERIKATIEFLESIPADKIDGTEDKEIVLQAGPSEFKFTGQQFLQSFVLPNVYFHTTTAYNIMRHNGVEIGKMDFLGGR